MAAYGGRTITGVKKAEAKMQSSRVISRSEIGNVVISGSP
jgi:hypothetical protein